MGDGALQGRARRAPAGTCAAAHGAPAAAQRLTVAGWGAYLVGWAVDWCTAGEPRVCGAGGVPGTAWRCAGAGQARMGLRQAAAAAMAPQGERCTCKVAKPALSPCYWPARVVQCD